MKLFKNLVDAVQDCLKQIMFEKKYSDKVLERVFKSHPQWGARDRKFSAEAVYDITRHFRYLTAISGSERSLNMIFAAYLFEKGIALPDWPDFKSINTQHFEEAKKNITSQAILQSYPDELWNYCEKELGEEKWQKEATALNSEAKVVIRANTLKISREILAVKLKESGIETENAGMAKDALQLVVRKNIFSSDLFKEGFFEVQDAGSQLIAEFLNAEPGQKIIDACAGAGGKSLHLAALMKNKGKIIAMDVEEWKLENLKKRAKRAGAFNIETRLIENNKTIKQLENTADRLLLDVPCSGTGVIKRNPDTKLKTTPGIIEKTKELQFKILSDYSIMLKSGGFMVYSTCSILPGENQMQVQKFLSENGQKFSLINDKTIYPSDGYDGFYMALLKKN